MIYKNVLKSSLAWGLQLWLFVLLFKLTNHIIVKKEHFIRNINFSCIRSSFNEYTWEVIGFNMRHERTGPWKEHINKWPRENSTLLENNEMYPLSTMTTYTLASKHPQLSAAAILGWLQRRSLVIVCAASPRSVITAGEERRYTASAGRSSCIMMHIEVLNFRYSTFIIYL